MTQICVIYLCLFTFMGGKKADEKIVFLQNQWKNVVFASKNYFHTWL